MKYSKLFFVTSLSLTMGLSQNLFVQNIGKSSSDITKNIDYKYSDEYWSWTTDSSNVYVLINWKKYASDWNKFLQQYKTFGINGSLLTGIIGERFVIVWTSLAIYNTTTILDNQQKSLIISSSYFNSATWYTGLNLHVWKDANNIYWQWKAYFKGSTVKNRIDISLTSVNFFAA